MKAEINVEFNEASVKEEIQSGEEIKTLFGKLKKWLTDLKPVAFSGSYNDLSDTPSSLPANGGKASSISYRSQFSVPGSTGVQYIKLGTVNTSTDANRAMITLIGKPGYNDMNCGGKIEICLSANFSVSNFRIGALAYDYGYSDTNAKVRNEKYFSVIVVRASGYSASEADIYLKFNTPQAYTSYLGIIEYGYGFKWTTDVLLKNDDPTVGALYSYTAPLKMIRDDYVSAVDSEMSETSVNPVQNKVIKAYIDQKIAELNK